MFTKEEEEFILENFDDCSFKDLARKLNKKQSEIIPKCAELGLERQEPKIGDVIKGWKIIDIYLIDNLTYAKMVSVLEGIDREREIRLTRMKFRKIGWPDKRRPELSEKNRTHGLTNSPLYSGWNGMKTRCYNPNVSHYHNYGGRGIKVYEEWHDFAKFHEWCINNGWEEGLTLDRVDGDKDYEPNNCRFATYKQQNDNRKTSINLTAFGETKNASDWSLDSRCNTSYASLCYRVNHGWEHEKAIITPATRGQDRTNNMRKYKVFYMYILDKYPEIVDEFLNNNY